MHPLIVDSYKYYIIIYEVFYSESACCFAVNGKSDYENI